ncbi:cytochrome P450 6A1 [Ilyonectria sp. MPI-CAGE-AT-0026]|nr:cytochrome P450 6A1 [Ilyonectria sp. MPI-CAGE-AT-0026]
MAMMGLLLDYKNLITSVYAVLLVTLYFAISWLVWRPGFPKGSPKRLTEGYPILGVVRFFSARRDFYIDGIQQSPSGQFSFYFGKHRIVALSGEQGRKSFFENKELDMPEGYATLFTSQPKIEMDKTDDEGFSAWFKRSLTGLLRKENLVKQLHLLTGDMRSSCERLAAVPTKVMDPFEDIYRIIYRLTMRTVGANDIAEDQELLARTLHLFEKIGNSTSPTKVIFPWMPTLSHMKRMAAGAQLYMILQEIVNKRKKAGVRGDDALQYLIDQGDSVAKILTFVIGALFAGQLNSGINSAWLFIELANNPDWMEKVRKEIDAAVAKHRTSADQTPVDILSTLTIKDWESGFPIIDICLRETIRFQLVGTAFRKNLSGKDLPIGKTKEIIPKDAFAIYHVDDVHFDATIYTEPNKWDPSRFLPNRAEDRKKPISYIGWGAGRHLCLGMRFAKLEMNIIAAYFLAMFNYQLSDKDGNPAPAPPKPVDRNRHSAQKPPEHIYFKYALR